MVKITEECYSCEYLTVVHSSIDGSITGLACALEIEESDECLKEKPLKPGGGL